MEKKENQPVSIEMEIDLITNKVVGKLSSKEDLHSDMHLDIKSGIIHRIQKLFHSDGDDWIGDYLDNIKDHKYNEAYDLLINKSIFLKHPLNTSIFESILKLDYEKLPREKQYKYLINIIAIGYRGKYYKQIEPFLDILSENFPELIDKEIMGNILLTKSDIFIKTERQLSANEILNVVINDPEYSDNLKAYAYRQLSWLTPLENDRLIYIERAHDFFIITGHRREAIEELIGAHDILARKSPLDALQKINQAIELLETESSLDNEMAASLFQKKAHLLFIQKKYGESLVEIQKAINIRKRFIGNEVELYSSFRFIEELTRIIGDKEKCMEYAKISKTLKEKIKGDEYMGIQFVLEDAISSNQITSPELKEIIFDKGAPEQKFGFLLLKALNKYTPFKEKLNLLDLALQIQEKNLHDISDKMLVYNAIAEIYREHGDVNKALEWYEKTFSIYPLDKAALGNYVSMLWKNEMWKQLEDVCRRYIGVIGYAPNLFYIYGKSLSMQSKYTEALVAFNKCRRDIGSAADREIVICSDHITSPELIKLPSSNYKKININDFIDAAKEVVDSISQRSRMHLWKYDKKSKKYKWINHPEEEVKNLFMQGISQKYFANDFDIIEEVRVGPGKIDLYIIIGNILKTIIELKICGGGYSSTYAISGEQQLSNYLDDKKISFGILIVFDGRIRDFSKGFTPQKMVNGKLIYTITVDMRPKNTKK
jgi:tetratricopeptide (TPR) repeat protein